MAAHPKLTHGSVELDRRHVQTTGLLRFETPLHGRIPVVAFLEIDLRPDAGGLLRDLANSLPRRRHGYPICQAAEYHHHFSP